MDRWLVSPLTLQTYRVPGRVTLTAGPLRLVGLDGPAEEVDPAAAQEYAADPESAARALNAWLRGPGGRRALAGDLGGPLAPLLTARTPEEFVTALSDLTGETDPDRLDRALARLEERAREARDRAAGGQGPALRWPQADGEGVTESPAVLALLALARVGPGAAPPGPPPTAPLPGPSSGLPDLDFSPEGVRARLARGRARKGGR